MVAILPQIYQRRDNSHTQESPVLATPLPQHNKVSMLTHQVVALQLTRWMARRWCRRAAMAQLQSSPLRSAVHCSTQGPACTWRRCLYCPDSLTYSSHPWDCPASGLVVTDQARFKGASLLCAAGSRASREPARGVAEPQHAQQHPGSCRGAG